MQNEVTYYRNSSGLLSTPIFVEDYYPYGLTRVTQQSSGFVEAKQYIAQYADVAVGVSVVFLEVVHALAQLHRVEHDLLDCGEDTLLESGTIDTSGRSYLGSFGVGATLESRFIQSGRLASVLAKSTAFSATASVVMNGTISARSLISNAAGTLAGRAAQVSMSYAAGSALQTSLSQLSQALASLSAQIAVLQVSAPSRTQGK
jgi:hypothetical protein